MLDLTNYNKRQNKFVLNCWLVINIVLSVTHLFEYYKGFENSRYIVTLLVLSWTLLSCSMILLFYFGEDSKYVRYCIGSGYIIFYTFTVLFSSHDITFIYIIPMISVMVVYNDEKLIKRLYIFALGVNIFDIILKYIKGVEFTQDIIVFHEIQLVAILMSGVFLVGATRNLKFNYDTMIRLNKAIEVDELTGLYNRHLLNKKNIEYFKHKKPNVTLVVIDIDNFKKFNDTYGHKFGDLVLKKVSQSIKQGVSTLSHVHAFRVGGDEFLLLGRDTDYDSVFFACERICSSVDSLNLVYDGESVGVQVSIGMANTISNNCWNYEDLYIEADANLYKAKNNGKNTVKR